MCILNSEQEIDKHVSADKHSTHHFLDDFPQGPSFYVLCDEVESLVLVEDADELEHIRVFQATHDLHLVKQHNIGDIKASQLVNCGILLLTCCEC